jgi:hypothetical protein
MNLDELSHAWRATNAIAATQQQRDQLIAATCRRVEQFWGRIFVRDVIETVAALCVIAGFGFMLTLPEFTALQKVGAGVVVVGAAYVVYRLHAPRFKLPPAPIEGPLREYCRTELARVEKQIALLRTVHWWYLGPIMLGLVLISFGKHGLDGQFLTDLAGFAAMTGLIYAVNQWAVRKQMVPLRDQLLTLRDQLESGNDEKGATQ